MKISRNTSDQLVLDSSPWMLAIVSSVFFLGFVGAGLHMIFAGDVMGFFVALAGGGLGVGCLLIYVERLQVILDRASGTVQVRRRTMTHHVEDLQNLSDLIGVVVETSYSKSAGTTWRPVLMFRGLAGPEARPVTEIFSGDDMARVTADAINEWLVGDKSRLVQSA